ncbi:MAG: hypothetical protein IK075_05680 [Prevotella sp.]|nr:hypothetical protein [Prevotella sp.]
MKRIAIAAILMIIGVLTRAQSFEFQYQGKSLIDGATVTIGAEEDAWGVLSCETNPSSNPKNGLMLKLLNGNNANVKAELQIEEKTFDAQMIQWCMGGNCVMLGDKNYLKKEYTLSGEDQVQFDASDITTKGHLLAKITVTCSLETHSIYVRFTNGEESVRGDLNGDGKVDASDIVTLVNIIMGKE